MRRNQSSLELFAGEGFIQIQKNRGVSKIAKSYTILE